MRNIFPRWTNTIPVKLIIALGSIGGVVTAGITYYSTPKYTRVGYQPTQPVEYNHEFHAGQLGLDCRYCHHGVEKSSHANIPGANVCMSCHKTWGASWRIWWKIPPPKTFLEAADSSGERDPTYFSILGVPDTPCRRRPSGNSSCSTWPILSW